MGLVESRGDEFKAIAFSSSLYLSCRRQLIRFAMKTASGTSWKFRLAGVPPKALVLRGDLVKTRHIGNQNIVAGL